MYLLTIILLMFVFPIVSIFTEIFFKSAVGVLPLIGKWFVFWVVGVRLFTAGLRQAIQPSFTAEKILGIKSSDALIVVQELGFANLSMGTLGIITIFNRNWILPAAIVGTLFYGLAGIRHMFNKEKNPLENLAMVSNLVMFIVFTAYCLLTFTR